MTNTHTARDPNGLANEVVLTPARTLRAIASSLLVVLLPKCPLCIAAYLGGLGVSMGAAHVAAPFVRPLVWLVTVACWGVLLTALRPRRKPRSPSAPCRCPAS